MKQYFKHDHKAEKEHEILTWSSSASTFRRIRYTIYKYDHHPMIWENEKELLSFFIVFLYSAAAAATHVVGGERHSFRYPGKCLTVSLIEVRLWFCLLTISSPKLFYVGVSAGVQKVSIFRVSIIFLKIRPLYIKVHVCAASKPFIKNWGQLPLLVWKILSAQGKFRLYCQLLTYFPC